MSTFRELMAQQAAQCRDELAAEGLLDDRAGVLVGAMVDAATIAVQDWLRSELFGVQYVVLSHADPEVATAEMIREAGKVAQ